jgi:hypothetical protein
LFDDPATQISNWDHFDGVPSAPPTQQLSDAIRNERPEAPSSSHGGFGTISRFLPLGRLRNQHQGIRTLRADDGHNSDLSGELIRPVTPSRS